MTLKKEGMVMNRTLVNSSNLVSVGYDPGLSTLEIEFREHKIYQYQNVPKYIFEGLISASSKDSYFNDQIKGKFQYHEA